MFCEHAGGLAPGFHAIPLDLLKSEQDRIRTNLNQITELLVNLDDLYNKREPAERRILNRALFSRITIDADAPTNISGETKLPRHQAGQFRFSPLTWAIPDSN